MVVFDVVVLSHVVGSYTGVVVGGHLVVGAQKGGAGVLDSPVGALTSVEVVSVTDCAVALQYRGSGWYEGRSGEVLSEELGLIDLGGKISYGGRGV